MSGVLNWLGFLLTLLFLPPLTLGLIRKTKARLQNRRGAPLIQPFYNLLKLLRKHETISTTASWLFRWSCAINLSVMVMVACLLPWVSYKPRLPGDDLFTVVYLLALVRFFTILSSLDTGSPFGAFGASREVTLSLLVEPAIVLALVALAVPVHSSSLGTMFSFTPAQSILDPALWLLAAGGIFLSALVELSRMPVDDPATHLELTMVHEAMILENSGRNLALLEFAYALRMSVLYGISIQCLLHAASFCFVLTPAVCLGGSILGILAMGVLTGFIEILTVKLQWRKVPEFIAYGLTMSLLAVLVSIGRG